MGILFHPVPQSVTPQAFLIALQSHGYEHIYEYLKSSKSQWEECVSFLHIKVKPPSGPWAMVHGHIGGQKGEGFSARRRKKYKIKKNREEIKQICIFSHVSHAFCAFYFC